QHQGLKRTLGAFLRDLIRLDFGEFKTRSLVISGKNADAFDRFGFFKSLLRQAQDDQLRQAQDSNRIQNNYAEHHGEPVEPLVRMIFFWLMADYGQFDKNNPVNNIHFQNKIREVSGWAE